MVDVAALHFGDHHTYSERSLARIASALRRHGADALVTTAKDMVKLQDLSFLPSGVALTEMTLTALPDAAFFAWFDARTDALLQPAATERPQAD